MPSGKLNGKRKGIKKIKRREKYRVQLSRRSLV